MLRPVLNGTIGSARQAPTRNKALEKSGAGGGGVEIKKPAVITASGLHPRKGVSDLIAAFKMAKAELPDLNLYIFGGGPNEAEYRALADQGGPSNITFCGQVPVLRPYFEAADVFVLASIADPAPLVISEAREAGLAVVATNVPGIPELLENGKAGILVEPRAPKALAEQLVLLFQDQSCLALWKKNSQFRIEHLHMSRVVAETVDVYEEAINAKSISQRPRRTAKTLEAEAGNHQTSCDTQGVSMKIVPARAAQRLRRRMERRHALAYRASGE
jgi:glycosyltransferase involved in cell wall biosynthesis